MLYADVNCCDTYYFISSFFFQLVHSFNVNTKVVVFGYRAWIHHTHINLKPREGENIKQFKEKNWTHYVIYYPLISRVCYFCPDRQRENALHADLCQVNRGK